MYVLCAVSPEVRFDRGASFLFFFGDLHTRKLRSEHNLIPDASIFHPFADPLFTLARLIIYCCIDPVAALLVEVVQDLKRCLFGALAKRVLPRIAKVHATKYER
jgi:hypothetical protein